MYLFKLVLLPSSEKYPGVELMGHTVDLFFNFLRSLYIVSIVKTCLQQNKIKEKLLKRGIYKWTFAFQYSNLSLVYNHNLFKLTKIKLDGVNKY